MDLPTVFVSYCDADEVWRQRLQKQLEVLQYQGSLAAWSAHDIKAGQERLPAIAAAIEQAEVAVLLVSADFLASDSIREVEIAHLLERRRSGGLHVVPVLARPCQWQMVDWLQPMKMLPAGGTALSGLGEHEAELGLATIAGAIDTLLRSRAGTPARTPGQGRQPLQVPELLPFLPDRDPQRHQLDQALHQHRLSRARRPLVVIVHGNDREAHDAYAESLVQWTLPELLGLAADRTIDHVPTFWSSSGGSLGERRRGLLLDLKRVILGDERRHAGVDELAREIAARRDPVLISASVKSRDWQRHEPELIHSWLSLWNELPDLAHGQLLVVLLSVHYCTASGRFSWRRRLDYSRRQRQARSFVGRLDLSSYRQVFGVKLEELQGVRESHVEEWFARHVIRLCRQPMLVRTRFSSWLRDRYQDRDCIPMDELATGLHQQLVEYLQAGG
jgi:hypothetical protein